jgi:hypothetical protein
MSLSTPPTAWAILRSSPADGPRWVMSTKWKFTRRSLKNRSA